MIVLKSLKITEQHLFFYISECLLFLSKVEEISD